MTALLEAIDELARQEDCSVEIAYWAMRKAGGDLEKACEWIRSAVVAQISVAPTLDQAVAKAAIESADAEFDTWGPQQLPSARMTIGDVMFELGDFKWETALSDPAADIRRAVERRFRR